MRRARPLLLSLTLVAACAAPPASRPDPKLRLPDGTQLHLRDHPGDGVPLVLPGASWIEDDLDGFAPGRRLITYDPRGRGRSELELTSSAPSLERDVADLEGLRARLGLERMVLVGWSYHGGVAVRYALKHPERVESLVLVAPLPPRYEPHWPLFLARFQERLDPALAEEIQNWHASGRKQRDPRGYQGLLTRVSAATYAADPSAAGRMQSRPYGGDPDRAARVKEAVLEKLGTWDWRDELRGLACPTLLIHGREDPLPLAGSEEYQSLVADSELVVLENCGHLPWLENPEAFRDTVHDFLGIAPTPVVDAP